MEVDKRNQTQVARMKRRIPIAAIIAYLFLSAVWGSWTGPSMLIVGLFVLAIGVTRLFSIVPFGWVINWPIRWYMGRNNRLWYWLVVFTLISTGLWIYTEPEKTPATVTEARTSSETLLQKIQETATYASCQAAIRAAENAENDQTAADRTQEDEAAIEEREKKIDAAIEECEKKINATSDDHVQQEIDALIEASRQKMANVKNKRGLVTDAEVIRQEEASDDSHW